MARNTPAAVKQALASPVIKLPSDEVLNLVLTQARNCPLQNMDHAKAVDIALTEVITFLNQIKSQAAVGVDGASTSPQASANA